MKMRISMATVGIISSLVEFHHSRDIWALISAGWALVILLHIFNDWLDRYVAKEEDRVYADR